MEEEDWKIDGDREGDQLEKKRDATDGTWRPGQEGKSAKKKPQSGPKRTLAEKVAQLEDLLKRAEAYATFMNENMEDDESDDEDGGASSASASASPGTKKRKRAEAAKTLKDDGVHQASNGALHSLTGTLRDYQVEGVLWLTRLFENGSHGILADEMGLGKTIQVIGLLTFMRHVGVQGPFIIVAPLSTIQNWCNEINKWSGGKMKCIKYHGSKVDRPGIMRKFMRLKDAGTADFPIVVTSYEMVKADLDKLCRYKWKMCVVDEGHALKNSSCQLFAALKRLAGIEGCTRLLLSGTPLQNNLQELWSLLNFLLPEQFVDVDTFLAWFNMMQGGTADELMAQEKTDSLVSKLHRILTPFVLRRTKIGVLPPDALPPKREVVVFCGMTQPQRWLYGMIHTHRLHNALSQAAAMGCNIVGNGGGSSTSAKKSSIPSMQNKMMQLRKCCMHPYLFFEPTGDGHTDENIVQVRAREGGVEWSGRGLRSSLRSRLRGDGWVARPSGRSAPRLCAAYPHTLPRLASTYPHTLPPPRSTTVRTTPAPYTQFSGKMIILDKIMTHCKKNGHRVLIFSQFSKVLDILEVRLHFFCLLNSFVCSLFLLFAHLFQDYMALRRWGTCRIDGSVAEEDRASRMKRFNDPANAEELFCFILTTRAGGQGINLATADTVVLFDSDWNPHQDSQAQDRAHRLGQKGSDVTVYRLVADNSVEVQLLRTANEKRKLARLCESKGSVLATKGKISKISSIVRSSQRGARAFARPCPLQRPSSLARPRSIWTLSRALRPPPSPPPSHPPRPLPPLTHHPTTQHDTTTPTTTGHEAHPLRRCRRARALGRHDPPQRPREDGGRRRGADDPVDSPRGRRLDGRFDERAGLAHALPGARDRDERGQDGEEGGSQARAPRAHRGDREEAQGASRRGTGRAARRRGAPRGRLDGSRRQ